MRKPASGTGRRGAPAARASQARGALGLPGLRRRFSFSGADDVAAGLVAVLHGWQPAPATGPAATRVSATPDGYDVASDYLDAPMTGLPVASAVCAVIADLVQAWADERAGMLALHAGAVRTGAGLVALTGPARAGKSTLTARLGLEPDWQVFCDDVLPVTPDGRAVALGIPPRLRLPVPDGAGPRVQALAARAGVLRDDRYAYVALPNQAPHGTTADLRALVVLDRRPGAAPCLHALPDTETLHLLMEQTISDADTGAGGVPRVMGLAARVRGLRLVYSDLEPAIALLRQVFVTPGTLADADLAAPVPTPAPVRGADPLAPEAMAQAWCRLPGPVPRHLRDGLVLWSPDQGRGLALNPTGAALWRMLAAPVTGLELAEALATVFPAVDPAQIRADVAALMGAMVAEGLIAAQAP